jgi:lipopolysaccharide export system permease protein
LYKRNPGQFRAELHERFASPLYPLAFVLIALATAGTAQSTRQNRTRSVVTGFMAAAGLRLAGLGLNNVVSLNPSLTPLLYLLPLSGMAVSLIIIARSGQQRPGPGFLDIILERVSAVTSGLVARLTRNALKPAGGR